MAVEQKFVRSVDTFSWTGTEDTLNTYDNAKAMLRFRDSADVGKNSSPVATPILPLAGTVSISDTNTDFFYGAYFDGVSNLGRTPMSDFLGSDPNPDLVWSVTFKQDSSPYAFEKLFKGFARTCIMRFLITNGTILTCEYADSGNVTRNTVSATLTQGETYTATVRVHVDTGTGDVTQTLVLNGSIVDTNTVNVASIYDAESWLYIGNDNAAGSNCYSGWMKDFVILRGVFTDQEIIDLNVNGPQKHEKLSDYKESEIYALDSTSSNNLSSFNYRKYNQIIRMNENPLNDYSVSNINLSIRSALPDTVFDTEKGSNVSEWDGTKSLFCAGFAGLFTPTPLMDVVLNAEFKTDTTSTSQEVLAFQSNGWYIRWLISNGVFYFQTFHSTGNFSQTFNLSAGTWYNCTCRFHNDGAGNQTLSYWVDGVKLADQNVSLTMSTTHQGFYVGNSTNNANKFIGRMRNVVSTIEVLTDDECLDLNVNGPKKYLDSVEYTMEEDFTNAQLSRFVNFYSEKQGSGTLGFLVSNDSGSTWLRWSGTEWTTGGSGYNTASTLNDNISSLDATNKTLRLKVAFQSPTNWEEVGFDYNQLGYNLNSAPTVICPPSKEVIKGESINPFVGIIISDTDDNLDYGTYTVSGSGPVTVNKGAYATLQEAFEAVSLDSSTWDLGEKLIDVEVFDTFGVSDTDNMNILVQEDLTTKIDNIQASIDALNDFDPANDTVAHVTLVDTTTSNTDMRGTDGANTVAPDNASVSAIKAQTDKMNFTGTDIKATLDGEEVITDTASRDASKADVSNLATSTEVSLIPKLSHDYNISGYTAKDGSAGNALLDAKDALIGNSEVVNEQFLLKRTDNSPLQTFDLFDSTGTPTSSNAFKRVSI